MGEYIHHGNGGSCQQRVHACIWVVLFADKAGKGEFLATGVRNTALKSCRLKLTVLDWRLSLKRKAETEPETESDPESQARA